ELRHVGTEFLRRRREFFAWARFAKLGIGDIAAVAMRIAEVQSCLSRVVQFVRRHIVAEPVATVVGEPELLGLRMPIESDGIANTAGKNFRYAAVDPHALQIC